MKKNFLIFLILLLAMSNFFADFSFLNPAVIYFTPLSYSCEEPLKAEARKIDTLIINLLRENGSSKIYTEKSMTNFLQEESKKGFLTEYDGNKELLKPADFLLQGKVSIEKGYYNLLLTFQKDAEELLWENINYKVLPPDTEKDILNFYEAKNKQAINLVTQKIVKMLRFPIDNYSEKKISLRSSMPNVKVGEEIEFSCWSEYMYNYFFISDSLGKLSIFECYKGKVDFTLTATAVLEKELKESEEMLVLVGSDFSLPEDIPDINSLKKFLESKDSKLWNVDYQIYRITR